MEMILGEDIAQDTVLMIIDNDKKIGMLILVITSLFTADATSSCQSVVTTDILWCEQSGPNCQPYITPPFTCTIIDIHLWSFPICQAWIFGFFKKK
jgi:hypothetical protein